MNGYTVRITDKALSDMECIYDYISGHLLAPEAAMNQYDRIADAIEALCFYPEKFRLFECEPERSQGLRLCAVDNYSVIYTVRDDSVTVLRVLYSASDILSRLRGLKD